MEWEVSLIEWLQANFGGIGTGIAKVFSFIGGETGVLLVMMVVLFCYRKKTGMKMAVALAAAGVWFPMIKSIVLRVRPYITHQERIQPLMKVEADADIMDTAAQGYSFPSGHSASASSMYFTLACDVRKKWMWTLAIAVTLLIGVSRFVVGVHYPTDVLAGWALGLLAVGFCVLLEKTVKKEWVRHLILLATALPGLFFVRTRDYYTSLGLLIGMIAAIPFERKYVDFKDTRNVFAMILRVVGAFALYYAINIVLKLPFSKDFLNNGSMASYLVRCVRYAVIIFVVMGVYPKVFPALEKIGFRKDNGIHS